MALDVSAASNVTIQRAWSDPSDVIDALGGDKGISTSDVTSKFLRSFDMLTRTMRVPRSIPTKALPWNHQTLKQPFFYPPSLSTARGTKFGGMYGPVEASC